jgi:hypothetical protein
MMKALSLTQPWATLVAVDAKRIETRSWRTHYRGVVAIHASKAFPRDCRQLVAREPFYHALLRAGSIAALPFPQRADDAPPPAVALALPLGAIIAVGRLVDVVPTYEFHLNGRELSDHERAFGDYSSGRFAWMLAGVVRLARPVPCRGALGLWNVNASLENAVKAATIG